ncbi:MAG: bifunctional methylenetetrahydrofolate dehydrogenase/methenyltetrahydrofolate cyclohydrolase FolD [Sulfurospirillaceae bacterium]|nr:bifunctional methylenetetrahydrofolate dehydrogenase/methenyltetrahydrofolate cyclohydrolase FolD [Sulfurospirillaceae bacterium]
MEILDGKALSDKIKTDLKTQSETLKKKGVVPALAVILVGDDPASQTYVNTKEKACNAVGITSIMHRVCSSTSEEEVLKIIDSLNKNPEVDGILVQLPLPKHIDTSKVIEAISPDKDVDGFHPFNVGRLVAGMDGFVPCTPFGVMKLLEAYGINVRGMDACVIGASNIVGKPMMNLLLNASATVEVCRSSTKNLKEHTLRADLIVVGVGKINLLTSDMVKEGAIVVDVGINRNEEGKIVGDVDFANVAPKCSYITPVPGGVGPMTIAMLLTNTIKSASRRQK